MIQDITSDIPKEYRKWKKPAKELTEKELDLIYSPSMREYHEKYRINPRTRQPYEAPVKIHAGRWRGFNARSKCQATISSADWERIFGKHGERSKWHGKKSKRSRSTATTTSSKKSSRGSKKRR